MGECEASCKILLMYDFYVKLWRFLRRKTKFSYVTPGQLLGGKSAIVRWARGEIRERRQINGVVDFCRQYGEISGVGDVF
ncbi:hypothetical protein BSK69_11350 [Pectobacterium actinidiae]|nr:hypothetical protein BSK69_11350 [Pectobacterium actinidiae]